MKNKLTIITVILAITFGVCLTDLNLNAKEASKPAPAVKIENVTKPVSSEFICVKPLDLVNNPKKYLNKRVKITAVFDKYSTLGLDYKPAFRDSKDYITFLVRRDDVSNNIPLSEMKNFLKRQDAEKHIALDAGDKVEYYGTVFSNALGDVWLDVDTFIVISSKKSQEKK